MIRVVVVSLLSLAALSFFAGAAFAASEAPSSDAGVKAFADVYRVLQSPRCVNCHPNGDVPHVGDDHHDHAMEVRRGLESVGMSCQTCHRATATFASRQVGAPPAVPKWGLPPAATPMVFEGKSAHDLCEQMKDPAKNGGKDAAALHDHVANDAIVNYGWNPGGHRTLPPLTHDAFVAAMSTWLDAGMPCP